MCVNRDLTQNLDDHWELLNKFTLLFVFYGLFSPLWVKCLVDILKDDVILEKLKNIFFSYQCCMRSFELAVGFCVGGFQRIHDWNVYSFLMVIK